mmetsp:Transcript_13426/g.39052  ORF Transcript_13426/g.39052 Transcript_13426/m.39052 type:complete len:238 (+) Transcript_13426:2027-2740(+)
MKSSCEEDRLERLARAAAMASCPVVCKSGRAGREAAGGDVEDAAGAAAPGDGVAEAETAGDMAAEFCAETDAGVFLAAGDDAAVDGGVATTPAAAREAAVPEVGAGLAGRPWASPTTAGTTAGLARPSLAWGGPEGLGAGAGDTTGEAMVGAGAGCGSGAGAGPGAAGSMSLKASPTESLSGAAGDTDPIAAAPFFGGIIPTAAATGNGRDSGAVFPRFEMQTIRNIAMENSARESR